MSIWVFVFLSLGSILVFSLMLVVQSAKISRSGDVPVMPIGLRNFWQQEVDRFYSRFSNLFKNLAHLISYLTLVILHQVAVLWRRGAVRVENRFSRMVGVMGGRADITKRGSVSLFLAELKRDN